MKSLDEATILAQLQRAETRHKAFEQIVQTYSEQLYWQIRRMVLSHEDANDILQNAFTGLVTYTVIGIIKPMNPVRKYISKRR